MAKTPSLRQSSAKSLQLPEPKTPSASKGARKASQRASKRRSNDSRSLRQEKIKHPSPQGQGASTIKELEGIRTKLAEAKRNYFAALHQRIAEICNLGLKLEDDEERWSIFCQNPYWEKMERGRPTDRHRHEAVRFAFKFVCGRRNQKSASLYWRAVGPLLKDGHQPNELPQLIREASFENPKGGKIVGLRALAQSHASKRPSKARRDKGLASGGIPLKKGQIRMAFQLYLGAGSSKALLSAPRGSKIRLFATVEKLGRESILTVNRVSLR